MIEAMKAEFGTFLAGLIELLVFIVVVSVIVLCVAGVQSWRDHRRKARSRRA